MTEYRFYQLEKDGHIARPPKVARCQDDDAAVDYGKQFVDGCAVEIWVNERRVAFIPADR